MCATGERTACGNHQVGVVTVGSGLSSLLEHLSHRIVNQTIAGHDFRRIDVQSAAIEIGDFSSGLLNQQNAGREIPRVKPIFPKPIETSTGNVSKIKRR